jgi:hypothetical protein
LSNPLCHLVAEERHIMTITNATNEQLELGFNGARLCAKATGRHGRIARAGWWFAQMRNLVGRAVEADPRPEQIWLTGATREVEV